MPRFIGTRDYNFFQNVSRELVDDVIQTQVYLFKLITYESKTNIYGESLDKVYYDGVSIFGMVEYGDESQQYDGFGQDTFKKLHLDLIKILVL